MNKKVLITLVGATMLLSGQALASPSNINGTTNSVEQINKKITLSILNQSEAEIKYVQLDNEKLIPINNCAVAQKCQIEVNSNTTASFIKFYGQNKRLVAAYPLKKINPNIQKLDVYADNFGMGYYVYDKLRQKNSNINLQLIDSSFAKLSVNNNSLSLLGAYFLDKMATNGYNSNRVISQLALKLTGSNPKIEVSNTSPRLQAVLNTAKPVAVTLKGTSQSTYSKAFCSPTMEHGINYFGELTKEVPFVGIFTQLYAKANSNFCSSDDDNHAQDFEDVKQKIDELNIQTGEIEEQVKQIKTKLTQNQVYTYLIKFDNARNDIDTNIDTYYSQFLKTAVMKDGKTGAGSLKALIASYGSWDAAMKSNQLNHDGINTILSVSTQALKNDFDILKDSENIHILRNNINSVCADYSSIEGDIISYRQWCNYNSINTFLLNSLEAAKLEVVFNDLLDAKTAYPDSNYRQTTPYNTKAEISNVFNKFQSDMVDNFASKDALIVPTKGLPDDLIAFMRGNAGCYDLIETSEGTFRMANVMQWNESQEKPKSYIVSKCYKGYYLDRTPSVDPVISSFRYLDKDGKLLPIADLRIENGQIKAK